MPAAKLPAPEPIRLQKLKLSMRDIEEVTGESNSVITDAVRLGHLASFIVGRRRFARPAAVEKWVDFLEAQSNLGKPLIYRGPNHNAVAIPEDMPKAAPVPQAKTKQNIKAKTAARV